MITKTIFKKIISAVLAAGMAMSMVPSIGFAAQSNEYTDPSDVWLHANGRTNEFDVNATTTYETAYCPVCNMDTSHLTYRVPEYTRTGETALNRGVLYSDGTLMSGSGTGNVDSGIPGVDATYTGHHWTKTVCQNCGSINATNGTGDYSFKKNVYSLNACDHNFLHDFNNTTYEQHDDRYHIKVEKEGEYCQYCKGTFAEAEEKQERHSFTETVDPQLGNQRFHLTGTCDDCGYIHDEYAVAKAVVESYYGKADGQAHSITLSDLSESGVNTSIRYGTSADKITKTSAPSYTDEGYYPVYYEITYSYDGESMTEDGVSYVWLLSDNSNAAEMNSLNEHSHDYRYIDTVAPTCENMGYELWQCTVCGGLEKKNYKAPTGHNYDTVVIREASCTQGGYVLHICSDCGDHYTETTAPAAHNYERTVVAPTCTQVGYTEYVCSDCGHKYITDLTEMIPHEYETKVTAPTCLTRGYTTHTCKVCSDTYLSDYTEPTGHEWDEGRTVTSSTCDSEGVIEYHCKHCDEKLIKATSAKGHTPGAPANCTEPQTCTECGAILEMPTGHHYHKTVHEPTCTALGYTVYECDNCDDTYVADYVDKKPHDYTAAVTAPGCTEMGYTIYTCKTCSDSYVSDYTDALGHLPSDWITDTPATIEHKGSKHIECERCGLTLQTEELPQLIDKDNSDEDGRSTVGDYFIIITDRNGKPVFDSEIAIDAADNITIKLPEGRLLDYSDRTTISVFRTDTNKGAEGLNIFIADRNNNAATGTTDGNGQLTVPNNQSSTGDDNGTIGGNEGDGETDKPFTYVVTVTDKDNNIIPNCTVYIGESNDIVVKLPDGTPMDAHNRITVSVKDAEGKAQPDVNVIVIGDADYIEKGITNSVGTVTLPDGNKGFTDKDGKVNVGAYTVIVNDEKTLLEDAYVELIEDGTITVTLPDGSVIAYENRTTVTVLSREGAPVRDISVTVSDSEGSSRTGLTDYKGQVFVPPLNENKTDDSGTGELVDEKEPKEDGGEAEQSRYIVHVSDKLGIIEDAIIRIENDCVYVELPDGHKIAYDNRTTVIVKDAQGNPVKDIRVEVKDNEGNIEVDLTDKNGEVVVPPANSDYTDKNGEGDITDKETQKDKDGNEVETRVRYSVIVEDTEGKIEDALVAIGDGKISVTLPDGKKLDTDNQTTVTVLDKDGNPVQSISVTVADTDGKSETKTTDKDGKITVPVKRSTGGGGGGSSRGSSGGGGGGSSSTTISYNITVTDKDGKTVSATKSTDKDGNLTITLPSGKTLEDGYYTIIVKDTKGNVKQGVDVTLKDKKNGSAKGITDKNGTLVLPASEHLAYVYGYEDGEFKPEGNMTRSEAAAIFARQIALRNNESIPSKKSSFKDVNSKLWYSAPIAYLESYDVISGYSDGTFAPEEQITRAEFVAMCSRFYSLTNTISVSKANGFKDVQSSHWAYKYINTAAAMDWVAGYADDTFRPDNNIKRAEVVAIVNRMTDRSADRDYVNNHMTELNPFTDMKDSVYWAFYDVIEAANSHSIVNGTEGERWVK